MQILAVDENNDLYTVNGRIVVARDLNAVLQACEHAAKTLLGEMVLAIDQGIPYFETVWNGIPNYQQFEAALRLAFSNVSNVVEVVSLTITRNADVLNYMAVIRTTYGQGEING